MAKQISNIQVYVEADSIGNILSVKIEYVAQDDQDTDLTKFRVIDFDPDAGLLNSLNALIAAAIVDVNTEEGI